MSNKVLSFCLTILFSFVSIVAFYKNTNKTVLTNAQIVEGKAECVMEMNSRRILYARHDEERLPMASTTKIVTALTVLESCKDLQEKIVIPKEAVGVEGSSVYLKEGEVYTVEDLLYGLMLRSGNDCAAALALYTENSILHFAQKMNVIAQKAGALCSSFKNPHGLPKEGHYTTARDLSLITCYAMQNAKFREIVATKYYAKRAWKNKNKILTLCEGGIGVKTGYTKQAGRCLVSAVERNKMTLVCSLLNCTSTYERSMQLFDDAFEAYSYEKIVQKGQTLKIKKGKQEYSGIVREDYFYPLLQEEKDWIEVKTYPSVDVSYNSKAEKIVGKFEIYLAKDLLFSGNLYKL